MVLVIGALLAALFSTPVLMGRSVLPQILPYPVVSLGFQSPPGNGSAGELGSEVYVTVTGPLGPVPFDRLRVTIDGATVFDRQDPPGYQGQTNATEFLLNVTATVAEGNRELLHVYEVRVTVNYTKPATGSWVPMALLEFPGWDAHTRFRELDVQSLPYKGFAVQVEVGG